MILFYIHKLLVGLAAFANLLSPSFAAFSCVRETDYR